MALLEMEDMIIVLPGILGSVLQKNGRDLWAPSFGAVTRIFQRDALNRDLMLAGDDPNLDDLGDGVRATALMPDIHMIPGFWKIDGYSTLIKFCTENFEVKEGRIDQPDARANLFAFPYDWRRDNRVAARKLKQFIDAQLPRWRAASGASDARVILMGHSMGGLVSRYYLEVLGGWEYCRALFTFGTPHRGSVNALNFLNNGYKVLKADVTEALRSFPSVYQLLPNYRVVSTGGTFLRVEEIDNIPGVSRQRAQEAYAFHQAIRTAAEARLKDPQRSAAYFTFPIIGTHQPTLQSAVLVDGRIVPSQDLPPGLSERDIPGAGDGTVPYFSSVPAEMAEQHRDMFVPESHASLQSQSDILEQIRQHLTRIRARDWGGVLGEDDDTEGGMAVPAISLAVDDLYLADEPVVVRAEVLGITEHPGVVEATITPADRPDVPVTAPFNQVGEAWELVLEQQPAGLYRIEVQTAIRGAGAPPPVRSVFEVG